VLRLSIESLAHTACELMWIHSLPCIMSVIYNKLIVMYCDTQVAMYIVNNPMREQNILMWIATLGEGIRVE